MLLHTVYGKGGGGGLFKKRGRGQIFFVRPLPQKLILHYIDTFVMQVSWIGSKPIKFQPFIRNYLSLLHYTKSCETLKFDL